MASTSSIGLGTRYTLNRQKRKGNKKNLVNRFNNNKACMRKCQKNGKPDKRRKKKRKSTGNGCKSNQVHGIAQTSTSTSNSFGLVGDIVTCEILSRLPVKSLMRFKCVCKYWQSLIAKDMHFINLHLTRSKARPMLFISFPVSLENPTDIIEVVSFMRVQEREKEILLTADLLFDQGRSNAVSAASFHAIREIDASFFDRMFGPVNGLVCFYNRLVNCGACVCNVSTREVTPWVKSTLLEDFEKEEGDRFYRNKQYVNCLFGFDPATKVHKVLFVWSITHADYNRDRDVVCEILTVGDNRWRRIDEVPPYGMNFHRTPVYVNGSIYYASRAFMTSEQDNDKIVAFDVGREKFRVITVPSFILDQPREIARFFGSSITLLEMDGNLALLCKMSGYVVKLWLRDNMEKPISSTSNQNWREATIELPYLWDRDRRVQFLSVPGTEQIILKSYQCTNNVTHNLSLHSYNWRNKTFTEVTIDGKSIPIAYFVSFDRVTTMVESLLPSKPQQ